MAKMPKSSGPASNVKTSFTGVTKPKAGGVAKPTVAPGKGAKPSSAAYTGLKPKK